ncbi:MAG: hypothetical protein QNL33_15290 [Akkermansiaceae bacterium]
MNQSLRACLVLITISMIVVFSQTASGEDAVFSADGKTIYIVPLFGTSPDKLQAVSLTVGEVTAIEIPEGPGPISKVARTKDGRILCMSSVAVHAWRPTTGEVERISEAGESSQFLDMTYDPVSGVVVFQREQSGRQPYWTQSWGARKVPERTSMKMLPANGIPHGTELRGMAFDPEGSFFFGCDGDLWHGDFRDVEYPSGGELYSYRYAPLAGRSSSGGGSVAQMGVKSIVAAGPWLYIHNYRMGGTGWGEVIRIAKPEVKAKPNGTRDYPSPEFGEIAAVYKRALESSTVLGKNDSSTPCLAASPDGSLVYFQAETQGEMAHWLVRNHGVPERLAIRDKTQESEK